MSNILEVLHSKMSELSLVVRTSSRDQSRELPSEALRLSRTPDLHYLSAPGICTLIFIILRQPSDLHSDTDATEFELEPSQTLGDLGEA
jgi:hypothetical protein